MRMLPILETKTLLSKDLNMTENVEDVIDKDQTEIEELLPNPYDDDSVQDEEIVEEETK